MKFGREVPTSIEAQTQKFAQWLDNEQVCPLPTPTGPSPFHLPLSDITTDPEDELIFHVIGDTGGVLDPNPQKAVVAAMLQDPDFETLSFAYHVGDVIYFTGEDSQYYPQFYEPYEDYKKPIVAIPGNHDGVTSLDNFARNFCAQNATLLPEAMDSERDSMIQPNVYFTLTSNLVTIIGLYSNVPSGGVIESGQAAWLAQELANTDKNKPLIIALHHPPYSADAMHGGSAAMGRVLDNAFQQSGRLPSLVLSGHVHNYQRFTRSGFAVPIPYIVCGAGGYHNLHAMMPGAKNGLVIGEVTLQGFCATEWGFLRLAIDADRTIYGQYVSTDLQGNTSAIDAFQFDTANSILRQAA
jgi:Icc-related predicted phosphoesterase